MYFNNYDDVIWIKMIYPAMHEQIASVIVFAVSEIVGDSLCGF